MVASGVQRISGRASVGDGMLFGRWIVSRCGKWSSSMFDILSFAGRRRGSGSVPKFRLVPKEPPFPEASPHAATTSTERPRRPVRPCEALVGPSEAL